jgi:phosphotransferase system  glucose/maltose/N-acetylglucosamine-specific IIC component
MMPFILAVAVAIAPMRSVLAALAATVILLLMNPIPSRAMPATTTAFDCGN